MLVAVVRSSSDFGGSDGWDPWEEHGDADDADEDSVADSDRDLVGADSAVDAWWDPRLLGGMSAAGLLEEEGAWWAGGNLRGCVNVLLACFTYIT